jgi:hypothetical protein
MPIYGKVVITIASGRDLHQNMKMYVRILFNGKEEKTEAIANQNPEWNQNFYFDNINILSL